MQEAQKSKTLIWWNVWVLLAMPGIWLAWAMVAFCFAIMSYVWRTGSSDDPSDGVRPQPAPHQALGLRVVLTAVFALGLVYFILIVRTFGSYGERETGWRRSWLATGHPEAAQRARERRRQEEERDRGRRRGRERELEQRGGVDHTAPDVDEKARDSVTGLGLLGVSSSSANVLVSTSSVPQKESDLEKNEKRELIPSRAGSSQGHDRISPKL